MDSLFAPWRYSYLTQGAACDECVFCAALRNPPEGLDLVVYRARHNFIILNLYPYNNGHLMIVPYEHTASPAASSPEQRAEMAELAAAGEEVLRQTYHPDGLNLGMNLGRAAGAGVEQHFHLHMVPRWAGDTNFMAVMAGTRVIPEDLRETREKIRAAFLRRLGEEDAAPDPAPNPRS